MYTLFIDTHFKDILLCLFKNNKLLDKKVINDVKNTSVVTMPSIIELLDNNSININNINKIAVVKGPGSFTSIRIGVTLAKVLAYSLKSIDLIGIFLDKPSYVSILENNGAFISYYESNKSEIKYLKNSEYEEFKKNNNVIELINIDYDKLINYINSLDEESSFDVNPVYIKEINI